MTFWHILFFMCFFVSLYDRFKYDKFLSDRLKICHSGVDDNVNVKSLVLNLAI